MNIILEFVSKYVITALDEIRMMYRSARGGAEVFIKYVLPLVYAVRMTPLHMVTCGVGIDIQ